MEEIIIKVDGMVCNGCENRVQNAVKQIEGIENVIANHEEGKVTITLSKKVELQTIKDVIEDIGFEVKE